MSNEKSYHFNHRTAWSRNELERLLVSFGVKVVTFDKEKILNEFKHFPDIRHLGIQSMYCWVKKQS